MSDSNTAMQFADTLQHPWEVSRWGELANGGKELTGSTKTFKDILDPVGWASDKLGCIIVTACTDRNSYEVEVTRQYRDKFLDSEQLRGYYCLAEKIVPSIENHEKFRNIVKKYLVDKLVDYGEYKLGLKDKCKLSSRIVSKAFLGLIKTIGVLIQRYVRLNGEVY
jgi:hypothetical protein